MVERFTGWWVEVVAPTGPRQADQKWAEWTAARRTVPADRNVRVDTGRADDGPYRCYLVRPSVLLAEADEVVVVAGAGYDARRRKNNAVHGKTRDPAAIVQVAEALRTGSHDDELALMMPPDPTIVFLRGSAEIIASLGVKDNRWVCCEQWWPGDAPIAEPELLLAWFETHISQPGA